MQKFLIMEDISIKEAMKQMNQVGEKALFVTNQNARLLGSLTDGDIRRWILKEGDLRAGIGKAYNKNTLFTTEQYDVEEVKKLMLKNRIEVIPVINDKKEIIEILLWDDIFGKEGTTYKKKIDIPVVIMAGGKGTRLDPVTRILPKPLIPIGDKAIIDIIMEKFSRHGVNKFYISINTKAYMIKSYFKEINTSYDIDYIEEEEPLGTAGSLRLLEGKINGPIIVSNCDIIVDCDYSEVLDFHKSGGHEITIVGSYRHFTIPYGICEIEKNGRLASIMEKPEYDFLVNTGMCVLNPGTISEMPKSTKFDMTDLIAKVKDRGGKVGVFPISEKAWIDIGQWEEYHKSLKLLGIE